MNRLAFVLIPALFLSGPVWSQYLIVNGVETTTPSAYSTETEVPLNVLPIPAGAVVIDFDDLGLRPCNFNLIVAFRDRLISHGVRFRGIPHDSGNGGGVLDECSNFDVVGHSPPNFLAFNAGVNHSDGGKPQLPEIIVFTTTVSSVQINVGSGDGTTGVVLLSAHDSDSNPLGFDTIEISPQMQTLAVSAPGIKRVAVRGVLSDATLVLDDLVFTPE